MGVSCGDVDSCQDDPQYKVMKCLVFGTILSSLLSELQIIIPKTDCKFEISRQLQRSRECMEQVKRAGTNGHDLD